MPKTISISLTGIVKQIEEAEKKLANAETKALTGQEKKKLAVKIKNLKKIKKLVKENCPKGKIGYTIVVPI